MKRVARLAGLALCLVPSPAPAFPFYMLPLILPPAADAVRARPPVSRLDLVLSSVDRPIVGLFREAWQRAGNGTSMRESVVLILKGADGRHSAVMPNPTNEFKRFTFTWHPATVAIVHTHPNTSSPRPRDGDIETAEKFNVPVFTITATGMFVYDPADKKVTKVLDGLSWLEDGTWQKVRAQLTGRPAGRPS